MVDDGGGLWYNMIRWKYKETVLTLSVYFFCIGQTDLVTVCGEMKVVR